MGSQDAKPREAQGTIRGLFPTPVVECMMPDAPALNAELKQVILAREKADKGTQHSNLGGWQSDWEFESWGGPAVTTLLDASRTMASQLTCDRMGRPVPLTWLTNCWANVNRDGHGNEFHTHPGAYWSASYYVGSATTRRSAASSKSRIRAGSRRQCLRPVLPLPCPAASPSAPAKRCARAPGCC